nr:hypothetical protein CFP56_71252 [Quercus suber]
MKVFVQLMHVCQIALSAWGGYQSYIAIINLQKYEKTSEKLAEWSNEAARQLHKTRTTQTSGALAILSSLIAATALTVTGPSLPSWARYSASPIMLVGVLFARGHIKNYWAPGDGKTVGTRIPLPKMGEYNEAQRRTQALLETLEYLEYSWVASSFVVGMLGYS